MPLKIEDKAIADVYLGDKKISKIYKGNTLVYQKSNNYFIAISNRTSFNYVKNGNITVTVPCVIGEPTKIDVDIKYTTMRNMFYSDYGITYLDLSHLDTSNITDMNSMFFGSTKLTEIDVSTFDTSKVTNMERMFCDTRVSSLDLSNFDTSNVINMVSMFSNSHNIKFLDLSNFEINNNLSGIYMFSGCLNLIRIRCKKAFKDWCIDNRDRIILPDALREGGSGTWEIID